MELGKINIIEEPLVKFGFRPNGSDAETGEPKDTKDAKATDESPVLPASRLVMEED